MTANLGSVKRQVDTFKLKPFATMLDSGGVTAAAYNVPKNAKFRLVVIDGEGKIAYNASQGWFWSSGPDSGKLIHITQVEKSLQKFTGLLYDNAPPKDMTQAAHLYDLQQFALMETELAHVLQTSKKSENAAFADNLRKKVVEVRKQRAVQIEALSETNPVQAYREALVFVGAYLQCPELAALGKMVAKLKKDPKVSLELRAEEAYQTALVPEMRKTTNEAVFNKRLKPLADNYMLAFGNTDFGKVVVADAVEAHRLAILAGVKH
jgi:hypothetical protein